MTRFAASLRRIERRPDNYLDVLPGTSKDRYFEGLLEADKLARKIRRLGKSAMADVSGFDGRDPHALRIAASMAALTADLARVLAAATAEVDRPANAA
jgi:hypothetical protein